MNTREYLGTAMSAIQDFEETEEGRTQLNVSREVYNLLADADIALSDGRDYEVAHEYVSRAWDLVHGDQEFPRLEHILSRVVEHVNFVSAYGAEHDK